MPRKEIPGLKVCMKHEIWLSRLLEDTSDESLRKKRKAAQDEVQIVTKLRNENGQNRKECERRLNPTKRLVDPLYNELLLRSKPLKDALFNRITQRVLVELIMKNKKEGKPVDEGCEYMIRMPYPQGRPYRREFGDEMIKRGMNSKMDSIDIDNEIRHQKYLIIATYCGPKQRQNPPGYGMVLVDAVPFINQNTDEKSDVKMLERWVKRYCRAEGIEPFSWEIPESCATTVKNAEMRRKNLEDAVQERETSEEGSTFRDEGSTFRDEGSTFRDVG